MGVAKLHSPVILSVSGWFSSQVNKRFFRFEDAIMSIKIRRLRNSDPILISAAFREMGWNKPESQYQKYCQLQEKGKIIVLVAEWNNDFAGYLKISWKSGYPFFQENNIPEIQDLNVIQKHRRKGVATNLMDEALSLIHI